MKRNIFTKTLLQIFLVSFFELASLNFAKGEIIDVQKTAKTFGEWKVFCEIDVMMDIYHCKIASKFYKNTAVISIEPTAKFFSQFFVVLPQVKIGSFVKIRVDKNDLILSRNVSSKDFGLIFLSDSQKQDLYRQMKKGDFLFLRFSVRDSDNDVTAKINLKDFRHALSYQYSRAFK